MYEHGWWCAVGDVGNSRARLARGKETEEEIEQD